MSVSNQEFYKTLLDKGIITLYEDELIEKLRTLNYYGLPVSIILLCKNLCNGDCYRMSMNLSRAMEHFTLVHGDVNFLPLNNKNPNHSWVEKDGFVYDTSNGFKWNKELYYYLFEPKIREAYNENTVKYYEDYQKVLEHANDEQDLKTKKLMTQYIELLNDKDNLNYSQLEKEIELYRKKLGITDRFTDEEMKSYQKVLEELKKK